MKISALRLFNVKRFANRGVAIEGIGDGVNVLSAANEFGKSTSFEALHALFFQRHSGTPEAVRRLRPYSGGNPMVEADIATQAGTFRIAKQFYGGGWARITDLAAGRLVAQADEAENFIANLVKGGTAGPAGLLWVRQGITGIEKRSNTEEEGEKQVRKSLLESVQGEVEAITGGRQMADIIAAVAEEADKLVSKRGPRAGGRYAIAIEERDRLAAAEQKLADEVSLLRDALDKRVSITKRLAELDQPEERHERRMAVEKAQTAFDSAKAHGEKVRAAEAELQLVRERRTAADVALATFRDAQARAQALDDKLHAQEQQRSLIVEHRKEAAAAIDTARAELEAAELEEQSARDLLARLGAALKAKQAAEQLADLNKRLAEADSLRRTLEDREAKLAPINISAAAIDALQKLEIEIAQLRAVEEAARPSVFIAYDADAATSVAMDGQPLEDGIERSYEGQARLSVPGIGTITLRSNQPLQADRRREQIESKRRTLLVSMGVDGLAQAREWQVRAQEFAAEIREVRARLSLIAPDGLAKLREEIAACDGGGAELLELKADPEQVRAALASAELRRTLARQAQRDAEPRRTSADEAFVAAQMALASLQADRVQVDAILGPEADRSQREATLAQALADLEGQLTEADARVVQLRAAAVDLETTAASWRRARSVEDAAEKEIASLRETAAGLNAEIRAGSDEAVEEKWQETRDALAVAQARVAGFEKEVAVLQKLAAALETARSQARELYLKPVVNELKPLLSLLFDDVAISFDDKSLLPETITRSGQEEDVDRLSGGMREQLSVLTRLAFARLLARDGRPAPVVLDDALVYSDDDRIEKMFDALHRQSRDQQIIVFSCRQRAFQKLGGNILRMTDWQPAA